MSDPLDTGLPALKRWHEFRAKYAAAILTHWVFRDLTTEATEAADDLWSRLQSSLCDYPRLVAREADQQGEEWDGYVPFHGRDAAKITWLHEDDLRSLHDQLFPHGLREASLDSMMTGSIVIALHSALEAYAKALGVDLRKGLVNGIRRHLDTRGQALDASLIETLDDCDATRHVVVHNRGCIDEAYIRRVRNSPFQLGEARVVALDTIDSFARAVFEVATQLRTSEES